MVHDHRNLVQTGRRLRAEVSLLIQLIQEEMSRSRKVVFESRSVIARSRQTLRKTAPKRAH
jgi:hypothetical protein